MKREIRLRDFVLKEIRNAWRVTSVEPARIGTRFTLREVRTGTWTMNWQISGRSVRERVQFKKRNLEEALARAEEIYFSRERNSDIEPRISEVIDAWLDSLEVRQVTIDDDYGPRMERFTAWCVKRGYRYWSDIQPHDLQDYADSFKATHVRGSIERLCRVVRRASDFAAKKFRGFGFEAFHYDLPRGKKRVDKDGKPRKRVSLDLFDACDFLGFVRNQEQGWNTLPGFALGILASLRVQEIRPLKWKSVDLTKGLVTVEEHPKTETSYRTIPICKLLHQILREAHKRQSPNSDDLVLKTNKRDSYGQAFKRYRDRWKEGLVLEPNGLRRTLPGEFFKRQWYGETLQIYRGHRPPRVSVVDWNHYFEFDQDGLIKIFRRDVSNKLDRVLKTRLEKWRKAKI